MVKFYTIKMLWNLPSFCRGKPLWDTWEGKQCVSWQGCRKQKEYGTTWRRGSCLFHTGGGLFTGFSSFPAAKQNHFRIHWLWMCVKMQLVNRLNKYSPTGSMEEQTYKVSCLVKWILERATKCWQRSFQRLNICGCFWHKHIFGFFSPFCAPVQLSHAEGVNTSSPATHLHQIQPSVMLRDKLRDEDRHAYQTVKTPL